jgi:hypothetical protein
VYARSEQHRQGHAVAVIADPRILGRANPREPESARLELEPHGAGEKEFAGDTPLGPEAILVSLRVRYGVRGPQFRVPERRIGPGVVRLEDPEHGRERKSQAEGKESKHVIEMERHTPAFFEDHSSFGSYVAGHESEERVIEPASLASFGLSRDALETEAQPPNDTEGAQIAGRGSDAHSVNAKPFERPVDERARCFRHEAMAHTFESQPIPEVSTEV